MSEPAHLLSDREHARLARELIEACGGLDEAVANCRRSKSALSAYQQPHERAFMPPDVINVLEVYCGRAIYSEALFGVHEAPKADGVLTDLACDFAEVSSALQRAVRSAYGDQRLTPREADAIAKIESDAEDALERLRAARRAVEAEAPALKIV